MPFHDELCFVRVIVVVLYFISIKCLTKNEVEYLYFLLSLSTCSVLHAHPAQVHVHPAQVRVNCHIAL